jgi:hypothetical protein
MEIRRFFLAADVQQNTKSLKAYYGFGSAPSKHFDKLNVQPRRLVFGTMYSINDGKTRFINLTNCTLTATHVESAIHCAIEGNCRVRKQRLSLTDTLPPSLPAFEEPRFMEKLSAHLSCEECGSRVMSSAAERFWNQDLIRSSCYFTLG